MNGSGLIGIQYRHQHVGAYIRELHAEGGQGPEKLCVRDDARLGFDCGKGLGEDRSIVEAVPDQHVAHLVEHVMCDGFAVTGTSGALFVG